MFKRILVLVATLTFISILYGCQSNKTKKETSNDVKIYDPNEFVEQSEGEGIIIKTLPIQLSNEKETNDVYKYKKAIIITQYDRDASHFKLSYYDLSGNLKWEKEFSRDKDTIPSKVYYFSEGIVFSYQDQLKDYIVKYDHKGNEKWRIEGELSWVHEEGGFFAIMGIENNQEQALYLDGNGEIVYQNGFHRIISKIGDYDDHSILYLYKSMDELSHFRKIDIDGNIVFNIHNINSYSHHSFVDDELYINSLPVYNGEPTTRIKKYDKNGNEVYEIEGVYEVNRIKDKELYLIEKKDRNESFVKYDHSGNQVFKTGPYDDIYVVDYLQDGSYILYTVDRLERKITMVKLNASGVVEKTAGPYAYNYDFVKSVKLIKRIKSTSNHILFITSDTRLDGMKNANVIKLDENLNELSNNIYAEVWLEGDRIFYKNNNQFGVLTINEEGTITSTQLEEITGPYFTVKKIVKPKLANSPFFYYSLETLDGNLVNKLVKIDQNGQLHWKMDENNFPLMVSESKDGQILIEQFLEDEMVLSTYDTNFNKLGEKRYSKLASISADEEHIFVIERIENKQYVKILDYNLNVIHEGKLLDINGINNTRFYYFKDANQQIYQITYNIN